MTLKERLKFIEKKNNNCLWVSPRVIQGEHE